ncbi:MAG: PfkB family carbohydrate kinase [Acutalibacteraceae bacterium]
MNDTLMVIGEALIDFTPTEQGVALKDVCSFTKHCGGAPINIAAAAAKLGAHSKVLTQVGADAFGDFILETLSLYQVDITAVKRTNQYPTALAL